MAVCMLLLQKLELLYILSTDASVDIGCCRLQTIVLFKD
jgi:hypothetical protein